MTLARLNELRSLHGKAPLKAWKESKAKLAEAIAKLEPAPIPQKAPASDVPPRKSREDLIEEAADGFGDGEYVAPRSVKPSLHLADLARELGMDPRVARAKMRRVPSDLIPSIGKHEYAVEQKQTIIDLLKRDFRKR